MKMIVGYIFIVVGCILLDQHMKENEKKQNVEYHTTIPDLSYSELKAIADTVFSDMANKQYYHVEIGIEQGVDNYSRFIINEVVDGIIIWQWKKVCLKYPEQNTIMLNKLKSSTVADMCKGITPSCRKMIKDTSLTSEQERIKRLNPHYLNR